MALTSQEKLALALTSAGSLRALSRQTGISHQKLGRWLREGEPLPPDADGVLRVKKDGTVRTYGAIPDHDPLVKAGIAMVFLEHKLKCKKAAKAFGVPFDPAYPTLAVRKPLSKIKGPGGAPVLGDRVFVEGTQFIKKETRKKILINAGQSQDYFQVSIQSWIDLEAYADQTAEEEFERFSAIRKKRFSKIELRREILQSLADKIGSQQMINDQSRFRPLYTRSEGLAPGQNIKRQVEAVEQRLREKMEPAAEFGEGLAKSYVFQLLPEGYESKPKPSKPKAKPKAQQTRKARVIDIRTGKPRTQGRGNK